MFYIFSKLFGFISYPINWILFLLVFAVFSKKPKRKQKLLITVLIILFVMSNPFISNRIFRIYEYPEVNMTTLRDTFDIGIVLGGFNDFTVYPIDDRLNFSPAVNRLTDALILYKRGILRKLLISGGEGTLVKTGKYEAEETKKFLVQIGIEEKDIIIESQSRNTHENAIYTKILIDSQYPNARCMLISSAFHLPRAKLCFDKVGFKTFPFPAHFLAERLTASPLSYLSPDVQTFSKWKDILREWFGLLAYKLQNYI